MSDMDTGCSVSAGLPNITGVYRPNTNVTAFREDGVAIGSFCKSAEVYVGDFGAGFDRLVNYASKSLEFNAYFSSPIYGASNTVTPSSTSTYFLIKF